MEFYTQNAQQQQQQQRVSSFESKTESPLVQTLISDIAAAAGTKNSSNVLRHGGTAHQLRSSLDARDLSSRSSIDIKHVVRASFQERPGSGSSVDGRISGSALRESPRLGGFGFGHRSRHVKDPPRASVDGGGRQAGDHHQTSASMDPPRLSMRIKETVRAAVEGPLDSVRASIDSIKDLSRTASSVNNTNRLREAPTSRSSSTDSRLLVELRESPRLSRDAPRYSCDGRDVSRLNAALDINNKNVSAVSVSRESLHAAAQKARESPRLSVDGSAGPHPPPPPPLLLDPIPALSPVLDERESSVLPRELLQGSNRESSHYQGLRTEINGKYQLSSGEPRRRVPGLLARLMGLEDLPPDDTKHTPCPSHQLGTSVPPQETISVLVNQQRSALPLKIPSKESKLLKGLLQYNPRPEEPRSGIDSGHEEANQLKHMFGARQQQVDSNLVAAHPNRHSYAHPHQQQQPSSVWGGTQEASPRNLRLSAKQLGLETMPGAFKQPQPEGKDMGVLQQKVVQAMPKQLREAVLTVLKNADENKKMPVNYADMENRLRQLRLRSSLQEHKSLQQILEAMQSKGLLNGASRRKEDYMDHGGRQLPEETRQQQQDWRYQNPTKQIMLPKPQEYCPEHPSNTSNTRSIQELKKLGSRLHEEVFGTMTEESMKPPTQSQLLQVPLSKPARNADEPRQQQQSTSRASIVVMKPIVKATKKTSRAQNPALLVESMPSTTRSLRRGRETNTTTGKTSPWGSPINQPSKAQPGFGFGRESTGRVTSEENAAAFKFRRDRILARAGTQDVQSEPMKPRSPKLIALPQTAAKLHSSSAPKEALLPDSLKHLQGNSSAGGKNGDTGRRVGRSSSVKEKTPTTRAHPSRDVTGLKKPAANVPEQEKLHRSFSEGSVKSTPGPAEVIILRNRSCMGKRVYLPKPDLRTSITSMTTSTTVTVPSKRQVANGGSKPGIAEKAKGQVSPALAPTTPRSLAKHAAEQARKKEEQGFVLDHVRVTDGDALDQSNVKSPLVGLTNKLQGTEIALEKLEQEGQGMRSPQASIVVKKVLSTQNRDRVAEIIDIGFEQLQPSPVSVLDRAPFHEEDVSPLALNERVDGLQGACDEEQGNEGHFVQQAHTALQNWRKQQGHLAEDHIPVDECSQQLTFLRKSAKILPPQGEAEPLILKSQAEKVYVRDVLVVSGATMGMKPINPGGCMIDTTVFDYLEDKQGTADYVLEQRAEAVQGDLEQCHAGKDRQVLERRMLFDCVNDALTTVLVPYVNSHPWMIGLQAQPLLRRPTGQLLVQQLWDELQSLPPQKPCEDICDSLYIVLQKDLVQPRNSWTEFTEEVEDVGLEVEQMIFKDLVEETLYELAH